MFKYMYNEVFDKEKPREPYTEIVSWSKSLPYHSLIKKILKRGVEENQDNYSYK